MTRLPKNTRDALPDQPDETVSQGTVPWIVAGDGTAGVPSTGVVTVQGIAGMVPIAITGAPPGPVNYALEAGGHLSSIDSKVPALGQALAAGSVPVVLTAAQLATLTPPGAITNYALEAGGNLAAAAASVASIDLKTPALGQALAASSVPVVLTAAQLATLTPPAALTNYALEAGGNLATAVARLTSIDGKTPVLGQALAAGSVPVVLTAAQLSTLTPPAAITNYALEAGGHLASVDTHVTSIDSKVPALGQALAAGSVPVVLTAAQLTTLTPPAAITNYALETGGNLASLATHQTDGTQKAIARGAAKGASAAADVTSTAEGADHQALDVQIYSGGAAVNPTAIRALTNADVVTAEVSKWIGSTAPTVGQKTMANSLPVTIASDQGALTFTLTNYALETGGHLASIDGKVPALGQALAAGSVPVVLTAAQLTTLTPPAAITNYALEAGGHLASVDTHVTSIDSKIPALGQALAAGSVPVVLTAAQLTTLTPPAAITNYALETGGNLASLATHQTDGTQKAIARGAAKGASAAADVTSTAEGADHQALDVQIYSGGAAVNPTAIRALTNADVVTAEVSKWIGSTAPTVGQKTMANSLPVTIASDQGALTFTLTNYALETGGHLASIDGKVPALGQALAAGSVPVVLTAAQITTLTPPAAITGFALEAGHLATIDTKTPALGQALAAGSVPVVLTAAQLTTLTPPAAITNYALETGGNLATVAGIVTAARAAVNPIVGQTGVQGASGVVTALTQRVTLATDVALPAGANVIGQVTANAGTNLNTSALALEAGGHLASIDTKTPALGQALAAGSVPVVLTAAQITTLTPPAAITGFALEAGHLATIDTKTPALGQALAASSVPVVLTAAQLMTLTPPAAITGFALEAGHLATIDTKTPALGQALAAASVPVVLTAAQITTLTPPAAITGFALEAGHLATIDTKTPALGQALAASSVPVVLTAAQLTTLTPPAAITGFALEAGHLATIDTKTPPLGQALAASSVPVVLASDQTPVIVAGVFGADFGGDGTTLIPIEVDSSGNVGVVQDPSFPWIVYPGVYYLNAGFVGAGTSSVVAPTVSFWSKASLQVSAVGAPTLWNVVLEASLDGTLWQILTTITQADGTGAIKSVTGLWAYLRMRCASFTGGGGSALNCTAILQTN